MDITVYREQPLRREPRTLPAETYNLARSLQAKSPRGVAFVPIRSMQVLAILDAEEFVFLDSQYKSWVMLSWCNFKTSQRERLDEPVPFEAVIYDDEGEAALKRLPREFFDALRALAGKQRVDGPARVLSLEARRAAGGPPPRSSS